MLQIMREKMQGIVAWAIVVLIAITFALWGIQYYSRGLTEGGVVAKVNGEKITEQQVRRIYDGAQQQRIIEAGKNFSFDQKMQAELKEKVVLQLMQNAALTNFADKLGLYVGKEQVQAGIMTLPMFRSENGEFSLAKFKQTLGHLLYSEQDFAKELRSFLLLAQLELGITRSAFVLPNEVDDAIKIFKQTRDFSYCLINSASVVAQVDVSPAEITQYYQQHIKEFTEPEKISIEYIELNAAAVKTKLNPSDAVLMTFYKEHPELFVAKTKSNNSNGGNSNHGNSSDLKSQIKEVYLRHMLQQTLAEQNDRLTDLTYTNSNSLEPAAKELGLQIKTTNFFTRADTNKIHKATNNNKVASDVLANPKVINAAFSESVLRQGYNSNPIEIGDNDIIVLRIKQHVPAMVQSLALDKVRTVVVVAVRREKAHALTKAHGEEILRAVQAGDKQKVALLSKQYGVMWQHANKVARSSMQNINDGTGSDYQKIVAAAFSLPLSLSHSTVVTAPVVSAAPISSATSSAASSTTSSATSSTISTNAVSPVAASTTLLDLGMKNGYALVEVTRVYDGDSKNISAAEREKISAALQQEGGKLEYSLLANAAMQQAKIRIFKGNNTASSSAPSPASVADDF